MINEAPAVFRNGRQEEQRLAQVEARLGAAEQRIVKLTTGAAFLLNALQALGQFVHSQSEALPGEYTRSAGDERRPH